MSNREFIIREKKKAPGLFGKFNRRKKKIDVPTRIWFFLSASERFPGKKTASRATVSRLHLAFEKNGMDRLKKAIVEFQRAFFRGDNRIFRKICKALSG